LIREVAMSIQAVAVGVFCVVMAAGCSSEAPPPELPTESPPKPWKAENLQGPFAAVADFCKALGAPACEERADLVVAIGDAGRPLADKDGLTVQLVTVASNDGKAQRVHLLLKRNTEMFALPPAHEYDARDGKKHTVTVRSLKGNTELGLVVLVYGTEAASGEGESARQETAARQAFCRVAKDFPVACALFETERGVATGASLSPVSEESAEVVVIPAGGKLKLTAHAQSGQEALKLLAAPGEYVIAFP
jgi:hypothetical protein